MKDSNVLFDIDNYLINRALKNKKYYSTAVQIDLTNHCNANCLFCFQGSHLGNEPDMSFDKIKELLIEMKETGTFRVGFDGGEPYCRKDFSDILEFANSLGYSISIVTNGTLLQEKDIQLLKKISLSKISVSIHSFYKPNYAKIMGLPEQALDIVKENVIKLKKADINVGIAVTVNKYNVHESKHILDSAFKLGIPYRFVGFNHLLPGKNDIKDIRISKKEKYDLAKNILDYRGKNALTPKKNNLICGAGRNAAHITYDGTVYPCPFLNIPAGNINKSSFKKIWNDSYIFKILRSLKDSNFEHCIRCNHRTYCSMCLSYNLAYQDDLFTPYLRNCEYADYLSNL